MPVTETLHLAHVLTQAVKGLLADAEEGVFASGPGHGGVRYWVARLEFQDGKRKRHVHKEAQSYHGRGTPHVHVLLWLDNVRKMELASKVRAELPEEPDAEMLDLVKESQFDWYSSGWPLRKEPTEVSESGRTQLHHPKKAHERNCRAYLPDVLAALRCHSDVLASDGRSMVLKYCVSCSGANVIHYVLSYLLTACPKPVSCVNRSHGVYVFVTFSAYIYCAYEYLNRNRHGCVLCA